MPKREIVDDIIKTEWQRSGLDLSGEGGLEKATFAYLVNLREQSFRLSREGEEMSNPEPLVIEAEPQEAPPPQVVKVKRRPNWILLLALLCGGLLLALVAYIAYDHWHDDGQQTIVHVQQTAGCENVTSASLTGECPKQTPVAVETENNVPLGTFEIPSRSVEQGVLRPFYWPTDNQGGDD